MNIVFNYQQGELTLFREGRPVVKGELVQGLSPAYTSYVTTMLDTFEREMSFLNQRPDKQPKARVSLELVMEEKGN